MNHTAGRPAGKKPPVRYYAVSRGRRTGIFTDIKQYEHAVTGFKGARAKRFFRYGSARRWLAREFFGAPPDGAGKSRGSEMARRRTISARLKEEIRAMDPAAIYAVDAEMTGLDKDGELLQVSIVNGCRTVLYNQYFKPERHTSWDATVPIHRIAPGDVQTAPHFRQKAPQLTALFEKACLIVGYNTLQDLRFLQKYGVSFPPSLPVLDLGEAYSFIHSACRPVRTYAKLRECAAHYGCEDVRWHDSLADAAATLFCFFAMLDDEDALFRRLSCPQ